ncbi:MAG: glycoside hydrolase family 130 protein [Actinobacteria bacterium]|nr:glycoside hydrolase family 130 protein [Actinomycetota bacterium]
MSILRSDRNPIIKPEDIKPSRPDFRVIGVFNCGVTRFHKEVLLLMRVAEMPVNPNPKKILVPEMDIEAKEFNVIEFDKSDPSVDYSDPRVLKTSKGKFLTSVSHLHAARSKNGIEFNIDDKPAMLPENEYEKLGIEDPRITYIDDRYYVNYNAISDITGVSVCLASTKDFKEFTRYGVIFMPDNKDASIFPEKIKDKYYALSRPISPEFGEKDIWLSDSSDITAWGNHRLLMEAREGYWDSAWIGGGAAPFKTKEGWVEIYHGVSSDERYCLGAVLLDKDEPWKIIARSEKPIIEPEAPYELRGFFGNVVFTCGALFEEGVVKIYYGAADTYIAYAEIKLEEIYKQMK